MFDSGVNSGCETTVGRGDGANWLFDCAGEKIQGIILREKSFIEGLGGKLEDLVSELV